MNIRQPPDGPIVGAGRETHRTAASAPAQELRETLVIALDEAMCGGVDELTTEHGNHLNYAERLADVVFEPGWLDGQLGRVLDELRARAAKDRPRLTGERGVRDGAAFGAFLAERAAFDQGPQGHIDAICAQCGHRASQHDHYDDPSTACLLCACQHWAGVLTADEESGVRTLVGTDGTAWTDRPATPEEEAALHASPVS